jgi:hypothetical protein
MILLCTVSVILKQTFVVPADMADRVDEWRHKIENMDPDMDRSADASDVSVHYASESKSSGLRFLVRPDELFLMSRPYPGSS